MDQPKMTSLERANALLEELGDVRLKYKGQKLALSFVLMRTFLQEYNQKAAAHGLEDSDGEKDYNISTTGIDIAITLLRFLQGYIKLLSHVYPHARDDQPAVNPKLAKEEEDYPLVRMIWADLDYMQGKNRARVAAQSAARWAIHDHLRSILPSKEKFSFLDVTENEEMYSGFWGRSPFLLWHDIVPSRNGEHAEWTTTKVESSELARLSKLEWDCSKDLGQLVSSMFGFKGHPDHPGFIRVKQTGECVILRVHMKPGDGRRKKWEDVREFQFNEFSLREKELRVGESTESVLAPETTQVKMTLVATVHMPREGSERLRLYLPDWKQVHLGVGMASYAVEEGQDGVIRMGDAEEGEWMLYYVPAPDYRITLDSAETNPRGQLTNESHQDEDIIKWAKENPDGPEEGPPGTSAGQASSVSDGATASTAADSSGPPPNAPRGPRCMINSSANASSGVAVSGSSNIPGQRGRSSRRRRRN